MAEKRFYPYISATIADLLTVLCGDEYDDLDLKCVFNDLIVYPQKQDFPSDNFKKLNNIRGLIFKELDRQYTRWIGGGK